MDCSLLWAYSRGAIVDDKKGTTTFMGLGDAI